MKSPTITSEHYIIRPFNASDAELWQKWDTDPEVQVFMPEPRSEAQDIKEQYTYIDECEKDDEGFYWSIETLSGAIIGTIALTEFNEYHGVANLGIVIVIRATGVKVSPLKSQPPSCVTHSNI
jgi:RimJ/RimL family protein N-acetyltransferase